MAALAAAAAGDAGGSHGRGCRERGLEQEFLAAAREGDTARLRARLLAGAGAPVALAEIADNEGNTALHLCAQRGAAGAASVLLLLAGRAAVDAANASGESPLLCALRAPPPLAGAVVDALLEARADPSSADEVLGETPLMEAACAGELGICRSLLAAGARLEGRSLHGQTAADLATAAGHRDVAAFLEEARQARALQAAGARHVAAAGDGDGGESPAAARGPGGVGGLVAAAVPAPRPLVPRPAAPAAQLGAPEPGGSAGGATSSRAGAPTARRATGLQQRCRDLGIPVETLGTLAGAEALQESERLRALSLEDLRAECAERRLRAERCFDAEELAARLLQVRIWMLLPKPALQAECRDRAAHVISGTGAAAAGAGGAALTREELVEALCVARWGGETSGQRLAERCRARGVPAQRLEGGPGAAAQLLDGVERAEALDIGTLRGELKKKGFALQPADSREDLVERLRQVLIWEQLLLSDLREVCKQRGLPLKGDFRRVDLMKLLAAESWDARGIPIQRLPSSVVAYGILDQVDRWEARSLEDLKSDCLRRGLAFEARPAHGDLVKRLRDRAVWEYLSVAELRKECASRGAKWTEVQAADKADRAQAARAERSERRELIQALERSVEDAVWAARGVDAERLGSREAAESIFEEIERWEELEESELREEYERLGVPLEPGVGRAEVLDRLRRVLLWAELPLEELIAECRSRKESTGGLTGAKRSEDEQRQMLLDRLVVGLCVEAWEQRGIPVRRFAGGIEVGFDVVEELCRFESLSEEELRAEYAAVRLPGAAAELRRAELLERLRAVLVWGALQPAELRKECYKYGASPLGDPAELAHRIAERRWGAPAFWAEPPENAGVPGGPRIGGQAAPGVGRKRPTAFPKPGGGAGGAAAPRAPPPHLAPCFATLGVGPGAGPEDVRKSYRRLALQHHPDKNVGGGQDEAERRFRVIKDAYDKLCEHFRAKGAK